MAIFIVACVITAFIFCCRKPRAAAGAPNALHGEPVLLPLRLLLMFGALFFLSTAPALAVDAPTITPGYGVFSSSHSISISGPSGSTIYYTLDGSTPTTSSNLYSSAFTLSATATIKAIAYISPNSSAVSSAFIQIDPYTANLPTSKFLWLKADNGVTVSGSNVTSWKDMSGNGYDATQGTGGDQPTFTSSAANGLPAITFDGTSDHLSLSSLNTISTGVTMFVVAKPTAVSAGAPFFDFANSSAADRLSLSQPSNTGLDWNVSSGASASSLSASSAVTLSQYQVLAVRQKSPGTAEIFVDGTKQTSGTVYNIPSTTRSQNYIGRNNGGSVFFEGDISEILVFNANLSDESRKDVEAYLFARYGIKVNPPTISPAAGVFSTARTITMTADPGAVIRYTTDGTTPTSSSTLYTGSFSRSTSATIKAIAIQSFGTSSVASAPIQIDPYSNNVIGGTALWLKADNGLETSSGNVTRWRDMSGNARDFIQTNSSNRPTVNSSASNGLPSVVFDGTSQRLSAESDLGGFTATCMFFVIKPTDVATNATLFESGSTSPNGNIKISEPATNDLKLTIYNGSSPGNLTATGAVDVNQFQVITVAQDSNGATRIYRDGVKSTSGTPNLADVSTAPVSSLGADLAAANFFEGEVAEVIVYGQSIPDSWRKKTEAYLFARYGIKVNEPVITPDRGVFFSTQTVSITADPGATIRYTTNGTTPTSSSTLYTDEFNVSSTTTVKAIAFQSFGNSGIATSNIEIDSTSSLVQQSNLVTWLKASNGANTSGSNVTNWLNLVSGSQVSFVQSDSSKQPTLVSNAVNGKASVSFDGANDFVVASDTLASTIEPQVFAVIKPTSSAASRIVDFKNVNISFGFSLNQGTSDNLTLTVAASGGTNSATASGALSEDTFQLVEALTDSEGLTTLYKNGDTLTSATTGRPGSGQNSSATVGADASGSSAFEGEIAELLVYSGSMSSGARKNLESYLFAKYGIKVNAPAISPAQGVFATSQFVTMSSDPGAQIYYTLDGSTPSSSSTHYTGSFSVSSSTLVKAIAIQSFGESAVSQSYIQIDASVSDLPTTGRVLWLKADNSVTTSSGNVTQWLDVSGHGGTASQSTSANRPALISSAVNSLPAVQFDGSNDSLQFALSNDTWAGGSVFVVMNPTSTSSGKQIIHFSSGSSSDQFFLNEGSSDALVGTVQNGGSPSSVSGSSGVNANQFQLVELVASSGGSTVVYNNGTSLATSSISAINSAAKTTNALGSDRSGANNFTGLIAEVLAYNRQLSSTERQAVENYLLNRYALGLQAPTITPAYGVSGSTVTVSMSAGTGAVIHYTTDGSTPTTSSSTYSSPLSISSSTTLKAIASQSWGNSAVTTSYIQIDPLTADIPRNLLMLWLKADNGVSTSSGAVTQWDDVSVNRRSASQATAINRPALTTSAINGLPAITFDGSNDFLNLDSISNSFSGCTIFMVAKPTSVTSGAQLINLGNGSASDNIIVSEPGTNSLSFQTYNGSTASTLTASSAVTPNSFQLFTLHQDGSTTGKIYTNSAQQQSGTLNGATSPVRSQNLIGKDNSGSVFYTGDIAEIMIYNRSLSAAERLRVDGYLMARYALGVHSPTISPGYGAFSSTQSISISADPGASVYYTVDGSTPTTSSTHYTSPFTLSSTATVKAIAVQSFATSAVSSAYIEIDSNTVNVAKVGLKLWVKSDNGLQVSGTNVQSWKDLSGEENDAVQSNSSNQPQVVSSAINGRPSVSFDGTAQFLSLTKSPAEFSGAASLFFIVKPNDSAAGARLIEMTNGATNNNIFFSLPSTTGASLSVYSGSSASSVSSSAGVTDGSFQLLEAVHNGSTSATLYKNGGSMATGSIFNIASGTRSTNLIGTNYAQDVFFNGEIAEILLYDRAVTSTERANIESYFYTRYELAVANPNVSPAGGVFATPQTVTITADPGAEIYYTVDGSTPNTSTSTHYTAPFVVSATADVKAIADRSFGTSDVSTVHIQIDPNTRHLSRTGLKLWLKADNAVTLSGSNVMSWKDVSGQNNVATQSTSGNAPTFVSDAINGHPAIQFDGTNDFMQLNSGFANFTSGITIVAAVKPTAANSNARILDFGNGDPDNNIILSQPAAGDVRFSIFNGSNPSTLSASTLPIGQFQVLSAVQNGTNAGFLYHDLSLSNTSALANVGNITRVENFLGTDNANTLFFTGQIGELLIYDRALSDVERAEAAHYLLQKYSINSLSVPAPIISVPTSTLTAPQKVAITAEPDAQLFYTLDGTTPDESDTPYTGPINIYFTQTLKAVAVRNGEKSSVSSATYTLNSTNWPAPDAGDTTPLEIELHLPSNAVPQ